MATILMEAIVIANDSVDAVRQARRINDPLRAISSVPFFQGAVAEQIFKSRWRVVMEYGSTPLLSTIARATARA